MRARAPQLGHLGQARALPHVKRRVPVDDDDLAAARCSAQTHCTGEHVEGTRRRHRLALAHAETPDRSGQGKRRQELECRGVEASDNAIAPADKDALGRDVEGKARADARVHPLREEAVSVEAAQDAGRRDREGQLCLRASACADINEAFKLRARLCEAGQARG